MKARDMKKLALLSQAPSRDPNIDLYREKVIEMLIERLPRFMEELGKLSPEDQEKHHNQLHPLLKISNIIRNERQN